MTLSEQAGTQAGSQATNADADELVAYETLDEGRIARIWLNRPEAHNAQCRGLLVQLDEAFLRAEADDTVRVVILAARGKNFSAGHDLGSELALAERLSARFPIRPIGVVDDRHDPGTAWLRTPGGERRVPDAGWDHFDR